MDDDTGFVTLNLTDAPVMIDELEGVNITITEIQANIPGTGEGSWETLILFEEGEKFNLLDLTEGTTANLADNVELPSGRVNQIRFFLNAPVEGGDGSNPGCFLEFEDGTINPLYIPSGEETGFKAVNSFTIPVNGEVRVTADFDARKSIVESNGIYKLKPTIRLIVDGEAGKINGTVTTDGTYSEYWVYAYEKNGFSDSEVNADDDGVQFAGSVTSSCVKEVTTEDCNYILAFLAEGEYDLVVAGNPGNGDPLEYVDIQTGVAVESGETTHQDIDTTD